MIRTESIFPLMASLLFLLPYCVSWGYWSCSREVSLQLGKGRVLGKGYHRIVIVEHRNSRSTEKSPVWDQLWYYAKFRITSVNNCSGNNHQRIEAVKTTTYIFCVGLFYSLRGKRRKGMWTFPQRGKKTQWMISALLHWSWKRHLPTQQLLFHREENQRWQERIRKQTKKV